MEAPTCKEERLRPCGVTQTRSNRWVAHLHWEPCAPPRPGRRGERWVWKKSSVPAMARLPAVLMLVLACSQPVLASRAANNVTKPVGRKTQAHPQGMYALGSVIDIDGCVPHHHSMPLTTCTPTWLGLPGGVGGPLDGMFSPLASSLTHHLLSVLHLTARETGRSKTSPGTLQR